MGEITARGRVAKRKVSTAKLAAGVNRKNATALDQESVASHQKPAKKATKATSNASLPDIDVVKPEEPAEAVVLPLTKKNLKLFEQSLLRSNDL